LDSAWRSGPLRQDFSNSALSAELPSSAANLCMLTTARFFSRCHAAIGGSMERSG